MSSWIVLDNVPGNVRVFTDFKPIPSFVSVGLNKFPSEARVTAKKIPIPILLEIFLDPVEGNPWVETQIPPRARLSTRSAILVNDVPREVWVHTHPGRTPRLLAVCLYDFPGNVWVCTDMKPYPWHVGVLLDNIPSNVGMSAKIRPVPTVVKVFLY
jgi:hypothetical protein